MQQHIQKYLARPQRFFEKNLHALINEPGLNWAIQRWIKKPPLKTGGILPNEAGIAVEKEI